MENSNSDYLRLTKAGLDYFPFTRESNSIYKILSRRYVTFNADLPYATRIELEVLPNRPLDAISFIIQVPINLESKLIEFIPNTEMANILYG